MGGRGWSSPRGSASYIPAMSIEPGLLERGCASGKGDEGAALLLLLVHSSQLHASLLLLPLQEHDGSSTCPEMPSSSRVMRPAGGASEWCVRVTAAHARGAAAGGRRYPSGPPCVQRQLTERLFQHIQLLRRRLPLLAKGQLGQVEQELQSAALGRHGARRSEPLRAGNRGCRLSKAARGGGRRRGKRRSRGQSRGQGQCCFTWGWLGCWAAVAVGGGTSPGRQKPPQGRPPEPPPSTC